MALTQSHLVAHGQPRRATEPRRRLALAALGAVLCAGGCQGTLPGGEPNQQARELGAVGLALQVADGIVLDTITYEIVGRDVHLTGTLDVSRSSSFAAQIAGVPIGSGYLITLRATAADDPEITCGGSAMFDVASEMTSTAAVQLRCSVPRQAGQVAVRGNASVCPVADSITVFPDSVALGASASVSAAARDLDNAPAELAYSWSSSSGTFADPHAARTSFTCVAAGPATLTLTMRDADCEDTLSTTMTCAAVNRSTSEPGTDVDAAPGAQPSAEAGTATDAGADGHTGSASGPVDTSALPHANTPAVDAGAYADSEIHSAPARDDWPGPDSLLAVESNGMFSGKVGDVVYAPPAQGRPGILWVVTSGPPRLYRLAWDGSSSASAENAWRKGKRLRYPNGQGEPDAEGVAVTHALASDIYVAAERDDDATRTRRLSVLRYDLDSSGEEWSATHEWNLTADLRELAPNRGIKAIVFVPDEFLLRLGVPDERRGGPYDPALYPHHQGGLFLIGLEAPGRIAGYALDHEAQTFTRILSFDTGLLSTSALDLDRDTGYLWAQSAYADGNRTSILQGDDAGRFGVKHVFEPPASMAAFEIAGLMVATEAECVDGFKTIFWSTATANGASPIWRGLVPCGRF